MNYRIGRYAISLALAAALAACASQQTQKSSAVPASSNAPKAVAAPQVRSAPSTTVTMNPLHDPHNILYQRSVYFDFDKSDIKPQYRPLIEAHAKYLHDHPGAKVTIQGNTDERGSTEYNIALGQRRADAVVSMMKLLNVPASEMEAISFGKEKPKASGHDEAAWAQNRRDDIVYDREK